MNEILKAYEQIIMYDNNNELLKYRLEYKNIPIWPLIRCEIICTCIDRKMGVESRSIPDDIITEKGKIDEFIIRNPFFSVHKDVIYKESSYMPISNHNLMKPYVDLNSKSSVLVTNITKDKAQYTYNNWKLDSFIRRLAVRNNSGINKNDSRTAKNLIQYLLKTFPFEIDNKLCSSIFQNIISYSKYLLNYTKIWKTYLTIVKPYLVVLWCASYFGVDRVAMKLACNELNIPTAEIQHSVELKKTSHAHYWGNQIVENKECKSIFPDYFLTFGKYWNDKVNISSQKIVVGTSRKYCIDTQKRIENILICLSTNYDKYLNLVLEVTDSIESDVKIYIRLHPEENTNKNRSLFSTYINNLKFELANEEELQYYLKRCTYVISCGSTVIYEALTCGKIVFVPRDTLYDFYNLIDIEDRIAVFSTLDEFKQLWSKRKKMSMRAYNDFFNMDYKRLYGKFVQSIIDIQR